MGGEFSLFLIFPSAPGMLIPPLSFHSDPLHRAARSAHPPSSTARLPSAMMMEKQFREHDELRFSVRSAKAATRNWKQTTFHLVANSYSFPSQPSDEGYGKEDNEEDYEERLGQVPQWLDLKKIDQEVPRVMVHYGELATSLTGARTLGPSHRPLFSFSLPYFCNKKTHTDAGNFTRRRSLSPPTLVIAQRGLRHRDRCLAQCFPSHLQ